MPHHELIFRCENLLKRDTLSLSDPFVRVVDRYGRTVGTTETVVNNQSPVFTTPVICEDRIFPISIRVIDRDVTTSDTEQGNTLLGFLDPVGLDAFPIGGEALTLELKNEKLQKKETTAGTISVVTEQIPPNVKGAAAVNARVTMTAPYPHVGIDVYRQNSRGEGWTRIIRSAWTTRSHDMDFGGKQIESVISLKMEFKHLNLGQHDRRFRLVVITARHLPATNVRAFGKAEPVGVAAIYEANARQLYVDGSNHLSVKQVAPGDAEHLFSEPDYKNDLRQVNMFITDVFYVR